MCATSTGGRVPEIWRVIKKCGRSDHRAAPACSTFTETILQFALLAACQLTFSWLCPWLLCCNNAEHFISIMMCQTPLQLQQFKNSLHGFGWVWIDFEAHKNKVDLCSTKQPRPSQSLTPARFTCCSISFQIRSPLTHSLLQRVNDPMLQH